MIKILTALVQMQQLDDIITENEALKRRIPLQLEELEKNLISAQADVDEVKKNLDKNNKERDKIELDVAANNEHIEKYEVQLAQIKTNKEYKALNDEIEFLKEKNSAIDDKLIELLDEEQTIRELLQEKKAKLESAQNELEEKADVLKKKIVKIEQDIEKTKERRKDYAKNLPVQLIKRYANLITHKNRKAVVGVNSSNGCGGCGFSIRPQLLIDINKKDDLVSCESCGRIIIDEEIFSKVSEEK